MSILGIILVPFRAILRDLTQLALENLELHQQLAVLQHRAKGPHLRHSDRVFWVVLAWVCGSESILTRATRSRRELERKTVGHNLAGWIFTLKDAPVGD